MAGSLGLQATRGEAQVLAAESPRNSRQSLDCQFHYLRALTLPLTEITFVS
jgi:hypothetical protein